jgi:hypothetical protein
LECPECGYENPPGRRHCEECGERLVDIEVLKAHARRRTQREGARYRRDAERKGLGAEEAERRRRRSRRHTKPWVGALILGLLVIAIVVIIVVATGGGPSAPESAVIGFYNAIKNRDVMAYIKHIDLGMYKEAVQGAFQPDLYGVGIDYDSYRLENLKTRLVKQDSDTAEVEVNSGYFEGMYDGGSNSGGVDFSLHPRTVSLHKEEGTWLVDNYNLVKLPYPLPEIVPDSSEFPEVQ